MRNRARCRRRRRSSAMTASRSSPIRRNAAALDPGRRASPAVLKAHLGRLGRRRLRRAPRLYRAQPGAYRGAAGDAPADPRPARASRPASASGRASCIRPAKPTRAGRTAASSCRSPATMPPDLAVPGQAYSFGVVKAAQARGDFDVLAERGRRALARPSRPDVEAGPRRVWQEAIRPGAGITAARRNRRSNGNAARHHRSGPDGRQHRAPADARRPSLRRLRQQPAGDARLAARARRRAAISPTWSPSSTSRAPSG